MRFYLTLTNAKSMTNKVLRGLREWKGKLDIIIDRDRGGDNRQKGPSAKADVWVTLEEMYSGTSRDMNIARNVYCPKCRGTGAKEVQRPTRCDAERPSRFRNADANVDGLRPLPGSRPNHCPELPPLPGKEGRQ
jgi:hypothetical protein